MALGEPMRKRSGGGGTTPRDIPDKLYFRIGEVARLCDVPAYVLRFWESEFPQLRPNKGGTGQRLYRRRDVEMALRVKTLLYDEGYTIPGARQAFKAELRQGKDATAGRDQLNKDQSGRESGRASESDQSGSETQLGLDGVTRPDAPLSSRDRRHLVTLQKELRTLHALLSQPAGSSPALLARLDGAEERPAKRPLQRTVQPIRADRPPPPARPPSPPPVPFRRPQLLQPSRPQPSESLFDDLFESVPPDA